MNKLSLIKNFVLDILFPIHCLGCHCEGSFLCDKCLNQIPLKEKQPKNLIIASHFSDPILKEAIHRFKYSFIKELASPLASLMIKKIQFNKQLIANSYLVPVPLSKKRLAWRGFNQSELLALQISQQLNIPLLDDILIRTRHSLPQAKIQNVQQRKENIKKAFQVNLKDDVNIKNKTLILIDDVCTTGATLNECAATLKQAGVKRISALVLAHG